MFFASDNGAPCPAPVMQALMRANDGPAMPYGNDSFTTAAADRIRTVLEAPQAAVHFVATGTAANALALATLCPPWGAIFCHDLAHVQNDECGAPEFFSNAKLLTVGGDHARMTPAALDARIRDQGSRVVHSVQPGAVTLTNVTEAGTVYSPAETAALADVAHAHGLPVHLDGARFSNAVAATGATPAELTWKAGIDALSFGGTKGGLLGAEAVVFFDPARAWEFELRRKRGGHLFSKNRYLAAQFDGWLDGGLWLDLARHANAMAARLASGISAIAGAALVHPTQANIVFATLPQAAHDRLKAAGARYYDMGQGRARLVTSWATTASDVDAFLAHARG
ncbi:low specificity L-threonine aldolase [Gemmobacter sp.]|uniref:threonine aldolase family protein n=1 Tax=Gemmobacter sp. TaxID=1898957 RepID=UPI002AFF994D|nr:low specificity L-threonine aldolase [Gemmobacter sp.]